MKTVNKFFVVFLILLLGVGFVSASDDVASYDDSNALGVADAYGNGDVSVVDAYDGEDLGSDDSHANTNVLGADGDSPDSDGDIVDYDDNYNDSYYDSYYDEYGNFDWDAYWDAYWNKYMTNSSNMSSWSDLTCGNASAIVTSNVTKYDFHDAYRVRVVDDKGKPVLLVRLISLLIMS